MRHPQTTQPRPSRRDCGPRARADTKAKPPGLQGGSPSSRTGSIGRATSTSRGGGCTGGAARAGWRPRTGDEGSVCVSVCAGLLEGGARTGGEVGGACAVMPVELESCAALRALAY